MGAISDTELSATKQDLVAALVQQTLKQQAILLPTVMDATRFAVKGAKSVAIPRRDVFAAADKTENTDLTAQELTFSSDVMNLDKSKGVFTELELMPEAESAVDVRAEIIQEMAAELALQVDRDIIVELKLASAAAPDHIIANTAGKQDDILEARRLLNVQSVPMRDRFLLVSPDQEKAMLQVADFVRADQYGSSEGLREGELGRIYGFTVMMHTGLATDETIAYHRDAVAYGSQMAPELRRDTNLPGVKDQFLMFWKYGVKVLDSGKRQVLLNTAGA